MAEGFDFLTALLCAYAVDAGDGRTTLAGVSQGTTKYGSLEDFPQYLAVVIRPLARDASFVVEVSGPVNGMRNTIGYGAEQDPDRSDTLVYVVPILRLKREPGRYTVRMGDEGGDLKEVYSFMLEVAEGAPADRRPQE